LDVHVMTKYCTICKRNPMNTIEHSCNKNHNGSSGSMETEGAKVIFGRSISKLGVKFDKYIGDGDSKAFTEVVKSQPYGSHFTISKLECVNHVSKRITSRLNALCQRQTGFVWEDDRGKRRKGIKGKGGLTNDLISKIQTYYSKSIRSNKGNLDEMRRSCWAILEHLSATDSNPTHNNCPKGISSWCKYQKYENYF